MAKVKLLNAVIKPERRVPPNEGRQYANAERMRNPLAGANAERM
jgi:hypothetical protein